MLGRYSLFFTLTHLRIHEIRITFANQSILEDLIQFIVLVIDIAVISIMCLNLIIQSNQFGLESILSK